jgi:hypothetical protein
MRLGNLINFSGLGACTNSDQSPFGCFAYEVLRISQRAFKRWYCRLVTLIAQKQCRIAKYPAPLGAHQSRAAKASAKSLLVEAQ